MYINDGIRCNAITPGGIKSEIAASMGIPNAKGYDRVKKVLGAAPPPGETEQIASAALFLASDESSYISGTDIATKDVRHAFALADIRSHII